MPRHSLGSGQSHGELPLLLRRCGVRGPGRKRRCNFGPQCLENKNHPNATAHLRVTAQWWVRAPPPAQHAAPAWSSATALHPPPAPDAVRKLADPRPAAADRGDRRPARQSGVRCAGLLRLLINRSHLFEKIIILE